MAIKVTLRKRPLKNGKLSLYLDFYPSIIRNGKSTRREFLGLSIYENPKGQIEKQYNKNIEAIAESIASKKGIELNRPEIYNDMEKAQLEKKNKESQNFIDYIKKIADRRHGSNYQNWISAIMYLEHYTNSKLLFKDINLTFAEDYKHFLLNTNSLKRKETKLSQNTALSYFTKFKTALKQAFVDEILSTDINSRIKNIKEQETNRTYLTIEELNKLANTECKNDLLKRASIFSALTGLRFSDVKNLSWKNVYKTNDEYYINFIQKKTEGVEYSPISEQAFNLLGERQKDSEKVFNGLKYSAYLNKQLTDWLKDAEITKDITFHSFRHTYATLQLANGTDLFTISKMLGHKNLKTTQIYAKIVSESKKQTTNKIILDL
ncbi:Site-specific recombinase XerD [Algoriella xinjiangensis]|uniref:Site-specific recombinase XerD n=1 Tax=Algoriella xinjiangensis TaxID=684065 RepID=A0A1I4WA83_9FLAO|nr:site-specific integrase [Algoriella xinjiangensis]SFN10096.1 Site-specific recombinase XerD [Algoriella xinjiangensis]